MRLIRVKKPYMRTLRKCNGKLHPLIRITFTKRFQNANTLVVKWNNSALCHPFLNQSKLIRSMPRRPPEISLTSLEPQHQVPRRQGRLRFATDHFLKELPNMRFYITSRTPRIEWVMETLKLIWMILHRPTGLQFRITYFAIFLSINF